MTDTKNIFGEFDPEKAKKLSREEYSVYEYVGDNLHRKTHTRKYFPSSANGYADSYVSEKL